MASGMGKSFINLPFVVPPLNTNHKCKIDEHAEMLNSHHFSSLIPSQMEFFTHIERTKVEFIFLIYLPIILTPAVFFGENRQLLE